MEDIDKANTDPDMWRPLSHEERTRHEILFFNQGPVDGFLPGDHARALFLRSKLPLHILSQIWNLVDQPQDNVLDAAEFAAAMHLLQQNLRGVPLPKEVIPPCLLPPGQRSEVRVPLMTKRELSAYKKLFEVINQGKEGVMEAEAARDVLVTSDVSREELAKVWDVSDLDRDGKLSVDEFCIACHLTRHTKKGRVHLNGPVNVLSALPHRQLKTDLTAKKAKMAELEDLKKRLMAMRTKKKAEAVKESEKAKIWKERLEILQRRHQALRDDPIDISDVLLKREAIQVQKASRIVEQTDVVSARLDKEQKQVRKETAKVIMEAEKLSQEVKKLQEEVNKLRETRRRTSQLKDLDPFHQLFEEQKEESLTGIQTPKKEYSIYIPFRDDPFNIKKLSNPPLSGEQLFNCSNDTADTSDNSDMLNGAEPTTGFDWLPTSENTQPDPWSPSGISANIQELTLGFEDSFVETWGVNQPDQRDSNKNILPEIMDVAPDGSWDFKFPADEDKLVFRTVSVTEEEDDLWSTLPPEALSSENETMKYLQNKWNTTTKSLHGLDGDLNNTPLTPAVVEASPPPPPAFCDVPNRPPDVTSVPHTTPLQARNQPESSPPGSRAPVTDGTPTSDASRDIPLIVIQDTANQIISNHDVALDVQTIENSVLEDLQCLPENGHHLPGDACSDPRIVPEEFRSDIVIADFRDKKICAARDTKQKTSPANAGTPVKQSNTHTVKDISSEDNCFISERDLPRPVVPDDVHIGPEELVLSNENPGKCNIDVVCSESSPTPGLSSAFHIKQDSQSSCESTPRPPVRRKRSVRKANSESSRESTPLPSHTSSPQAPPRSRSVKKKSPAPKPPAPKPPTIESLLQTQRTALRKQLNFDKEAQNETSIEQLESKEAEKHLSRCTSLPVEHSILHESSTHSNGVVSVKNENGLSSVSKSESDCNVQIEPPKPPPRLKKRLRLSKSVHITSHSDASRDKLPRSRSLPSESTTYENIEFQPTGNNIPEEQNDKPAEDSRITAQGTVSVVHIQKCQDSSVDLGEQTNIRINVGLDDSIPHNPECLNGRTYHESENQYVNVINVESSNEDTQGPSDGDMDAKARKEELENLRAQFFGKKQTAVSGSPAAMSPTDGNVTLTTTVVTVSDEVPVDTQTQEGGATLIQIGSDTRRTPSPETPETSLYGIIRKQKDSSNNNSGEVTHVSESQPTASKIVLDLDEYQTKREVDPIVDVSSIPAPSKIMFDLDEHQTVREFVPQEAKSQSRILLDLDEFSSHAELDSGFNSNNNTLTSESLIDDSSQRSKMLLDLDEIQVVPEIEKQSRLEDLPVNPEGQVTNEHDGFGKEYLLSDLPTPETPVSPDAGWKMAEDSDMSEGEETFSATFTPGSDVVPEYSALEDEPYEDSGIVLVSYQQKTTNPDFLDLGLQGEPGTIQNQPMTSESSFDPFSAPVWDSHAADAEVIEGSDPYMDVSLKDSNGDLLMDMPAPPDDFRVSYPDTEKEASPNVIDSDDLVHVDKNSNLERHSTQEAIDNTREVDYLIDPELNTTTTWLVEPSHSSVHSDTAPRMTTGLGDPWQVSTNIEPSALNSQNSKSLVDPGISTDIYSTPEYGQKDSRRSDSPASRDGLILDLSPTPQSTESPDPESDMDPVTGLRRTGIMSPMEKAMHFVENTELTYKVRKKEVPGEVSEPLSPEQVAISLELEHERQEIMGAMRVRKKRMDSWVQDSLEGGNNKWMSDSERKYEERKKKSSGSRDSPELDLSQVPAPHWSAVIRDPQYADVDSKKYPEKELNFTEDTNTPDLEHLSLNVDSNLSYDLNFDDRQHKERENNNVNIHESSIDREIRLAREREDELKLLQQNRLQEQEAEMPIHKVPDLVYVDKGPVMSKSMSANPPLPTSPPPSATMYKELPEVDRDSAILKRESIIEKEIREQQEREWALKAEGSRRTQDKEAEQSEFERKEKEHERVEAHESIVDREIREQRQREKELVSLRHSVSSTPTSLPDIEPSSTVPNRPTSPAPYSVTMTTTHSREPDYQADVSYEVHTTTTTTTHQEPAQSTIAYEDAIKSKTHEGESIIARELREQREREDELRKHYTEMGLENLLARQEPSDTPYNRPDPKQPDITKLPASAKTNLKTGKMTKSVSEPVQISLPRPVKREISAEPIRVTSSVSHDALSASQRPESVSEEPQKSKVRQIPADEVDGYDHSYRFVPQNETPIEREMRLAREREEELRQSRGFPKTSSDPDAVVEIQQITQVVNRPHITYKKGDEGDGKAHQKFASSRLQHEIQMEKRREQALKSQGMINTLSEERVSGPTKYVDVIPRSSVDVKVTPNWKTQMSVTTTTQSTVSPGGSVASVGYDATDTSLAHGSVGHVGGQNGPPAHATQQQDAATSKNLKPEPAIVQRYSTHTKQLVDTSTVRYRDRPSPHVAESRIEQELREMREREEELRGLDPDDETVRRSFTDLKSPTNGDLRSNFEMPSNGHDVYVRTSSSSSDSSKATRRKSALAEEWEKKFGAN